MNIFFKSTSIPPIPSIQLDGVSAESFLVGKSERCKQLFLILLDKAPDVKLSDLLAVSELLDDFEIKWNAEDSTVESATNDTFHLISTVCGDSKISLMVTDQYLVDFFSSVDDLGSRLNFEKISEKNINLVTMCTLLYQARLAFHFFEVQIKPYWSKSTRDFRRNIFYIPPEHDHQSNENKISILLLLGGGVFSILQSSLISETTPSIVQDLLKRIRKMIVAILSHQDAFTLDEEAAIFDSECIRFSVDGELSIFLAYLIATSTRVPRISDAMFAKLNLKSLGFHIVRDSFGDQERWIAAPSRTVALHAVESKPESFDNHVKSMRLVLKAFIGQGNFEHVLERLIGSPLVSKACLLQDPDTGDFLLHDLLSFCDKKKSSKEPSLLSPAISRKAVLVHTILSHLYPHLEERVNIFVRGVEAYPFKDILLNNVITCQLILLSVFNKTPYFDAHLTSKAIFKARIKAAFSVFDEDLTDQFINSFHFLYFLTNNYPVPPAFKELLNDLNTVLEVLRESGESFIRSIRTALIDEERTFPKRSLMDIKPLVDIKLWEAAQKEREAQGRLAEAEFFGDEGSPPKAAKPRKKKKKSPTIEPSEHPDTPKASSVTPELPVSLVVDEGPVPASMATAPELPLSPKPLIHISEESMRVFKELSEQNQLILKNLDDFRDRIELRRSHASVFEQPVLHALDQVLAARKELMKGFRASVKKAKEQKAIQFKRMSLATDKLILPNWMESDLVAYETSLSSLITRLQSIDNASTLTLDIPEWIEMLRSSFIPKIFLREFPSFNHLLFFKDRIDAIARDFRPDLQRILGNEHRHRLGVLAVDAKNFGQLIHQVQHWIDSIVIAGFDEHEFNDIRFDGVVSFAPEEVIHPNLDGGLGHRFLSLILRWNSEINQFAMALLSIIDAEPNLVFTRTLKKLVHQLSSSYFKDRPDACVQTVNDLFHGYAKIERIGSGLFMQDSICDDDFRFKWRNHLDTIDKVVATIKTILTRAGIPLDVIRSIAKPKLSLPDGRLIEVLNIKLWMGKSVPPWDLTIFVGGHDFPLVSYVSHAAGIHYTDTGRVHIPHPCRQAIFNRQLALMESSVPDVSPVARHSRLAHILKYIIRATYSERAEARLLLDDSAYKILGLLKTYRSKMIELSTVDPDLVQALHLLLKKHFKQDELTPAFFERTRVLLTFFKDIECQVLLHDKGRQWQLCAANAESGELTCKEMADSDRLPLGHEISPTAFLVSLSDTISKRISRVLQAPVIPAAFFALAPVARPPATEAPITMMAAGIVREAQGGH